MSEKILQVSNLSYHYPRREPVLDQVNFSWFEGERVALTGHNGAGKTTFFHLLMGLKKAKRGEIEIAGQSCRSEPDFLQARREIGFLFQDPDDQLFCPTVIEDVAFGPLNLGKSRDEALLIARETLASLGLEGFEERICYQLSGGEKRLVTLAGVLAMKPKALLLDEPTNALDRNARRRLIDILSGLPQAMLIISHDPEFLAEICNRRIELSDGKFHEQPHSAAALVG